MTPSARSIVDDLLAAYAVGRHLVLLFDYDGTLVPIADHPRLARLSPGSRRLLERLADRPHTHVGIISGRTLEELREMVCVSGLCLAGTTGLELDLGGLHLVHRRARQARAVIEEVAARVAPCLAGFPGAWLEDKELGFTVHFRHTPPHLTETLRKKVRQVLDPVASSLRSNDGPMAVEVTAALGWDKGTAVSLIVRHLKLREYALVYAGDSDNDVAAFRTAITLGGTAIGVGPEAPSAAQVSLPGSEALQELLADLEQGLSLIPGPADLAAPRALECLTAVPTMLRKSSLTPHQRKDRA